jgi:hypothetical protein
MTSFTDYSTIVTASWLNAADGIVTDPAVVALASVTPASDRLPYYTGPASAALATFTATGRAIVGSATSAAVLTAIGGAPLASPQFTGTVNMAGDLVVDGAVTLSSGNNTWVGGISRPLANRLTTVFTPEDFGCVGNGSTDDTVNFGKMMTAVAAAGGGVVRLRRDANYAIAPTALNGASMFTLNNVNGLDFDGSGALITINYTYTYGPAAYHNVFYFTSSQNLFIRNIRVTGMAIDPTNVYSNPTGFRSFVFGPSCKNVVVDNMTQYGGNESVASYLGASYTEAEQPENFRFTNIVSNWTVYGPSFSSGGKNVYVQAKVSNQARGLFIESVQNGTFVLDSCDAYMADVLVSASHSSVQEVKVCRNLDITYRASGRTRNSTAMACNILPRSDDGGAASISNVKFKFDIDAAGGSNVSVVCQAYRQYPYGTLDTGIARGHTVEEIEFSGSIRNVTSTEKVFELFEGWPAGENVRNISFNGVSVTGSGNSSITVDRTPFDGPLSFKNVYVNCGTTDIVYTGTWNATTTMDNVISYNTRWGTTVVGKLHIGGESSAHALYTAGGRIQFNLSGATGCEMTQNTAGSLIANLATTVTTAGQAYGMQIAAGTNSSDYALRVWKQDGTTKIFDCLGSGYVGVGGTPLAPFHVIEGTATMIAQFQGTPIYGNKTYSQNLFGKQATNEGMLFGHVYDTGTPGNSFAALNFYGGGVGDVMKFGVNKNVIIGSAALATNATAGFPWIPSCAGVPTGAPTAPYTNASAMVVDTTNNRIYFLVGATWRYATLT